MNRQYTSMYRSIEVLVCLSINRFVPIHGPCLSPHAIYNLAGTHLVTFTVVAHKMVHQLGGSSFAVLVSLLMDQFLPTCELYLPIYEPCCLPIHECWDGAHYFT
jgi:hypothetical protein